MPPKHVRVRIAPSPTGFFHIGTARTALFNWLYARKVKGSFIVRIEDTDEARGNPDYERVIFESLLWLGLDWGEGPEWVRADGSRVGGRGSMGPYRQSERKAIYKQYLEQLLTQGNAYWCFCTHEELEAERQSRLASGAPGIYSSKCRSIPAKKAKERRQAGEAAVLRFKMPEEKISFPDIIRNKVEFDMRLIGDTVIAKSLDQPLFDVANVIDDELMEITHVIRGEEHIPNTPKQIALARALGFRELYYAHIPLILNADRSKMSKRFSATSLSEYKKAGYLPEAFVNFLALLGWHPEAEKVTEGKVHEQEMFSLVELANIFSLERVQKGGAIFNTEKLDWMNNQYLRRMSDEEILAKLTDMLQTPRTLPQKAILSIINITKPRLHKLSEFMGLTDFFFGLEEYPPLLLLWKDTPKEAILQNLIDARATLENVGDAEFV